MMNIHLSVQPIIHTYLDQSLHLITVCCTTNLIGTGFFNEGLFQLVVIAVSSGSRNLSEGEGR